MANERIEIDVVLADGSVAKAFAQIPDAAKKSAKKAQESLGGIENDLKSLGNGITKIKGSFLALGAAIGAGFAVNKISDFIGDVIKEASDGQVEINNLANSLRAAGSLTQGAVDSFNEFSDAIENTTTVSKGQTLQIAALARNYTKTNEEAIKLTQASIQLSAATGVDLNSAVDQLGGTLQGVGGRLGKTIPGFKSLSEEALKSGAALDLVLSRFGGSAESKINTFAGSIELLKNQFNTFLGDIGDLIIRSPAVLAVFTEVGNLFREFSKSISTIKTENKDVLRPIIEQAIEFGLVINQFVIRPLETIASVVKTSFNIIKLSFDTQIALVGKLAGALGKVINFFDEDNAVADNLLTFSESTEAVFLNQIDNVASSASGILEQGFSNGVETTLNRIKESVANASTTLLDEVKIDTRNNGLTNALVGATDTASLEIQKKLGELKGEALIARSELEKLGQADIFGGLTTQLSTLPDALAIANTQTIGEVQQQLAQFKAIKEEVVNTSNQIKSAIQTGLTNAISQGVQSVVTALTTGKNAFKAFLGVILGVFGDLAIQIGTTLIGIGIGIDALKKSLFTLSGGIAIAAGIALVAVGSLLKSFSGGLGAAPTPAGSSLTAPGTPATPVSNTADQIQERGAQVNLVVEGNVYDPQGTGLAIANLLKEAGFDGAVVV